MLIDFPNLPINAIVRVQTTNLGNIEGVTQNAGTGFSSSYRARAVCVNNVPNPTAGLIDIGTMQLDALGTAQLREGDVVLLQAQTTAAQRGPYVMGPINASFFTTLSRPSWWRSGSTVESGQEINVGGEGANFANTKWASMPTAEQTVVDTNDPELFPRFVTRNLILAAGTATFTNCPVKASGGFALVRTALGGTVTSTVMYHVTSFTPGPLGTCSITVQAAVAAGTINNVDTSTLRLSVLNQS